MVTGATSGIGLGMARSFARDGMSVVLCDIRGDRLDAALGEVRALGGRAIAVVTDVSDRASVRAAGDAAIKAFGALHVACNNAGITIHGRSVARADAAGVGMERRGELLWGGARAGSLPAADLPSTAGGPHRQYGLDRGVPDRRAPAQRSYGAMKFAVVALSEVHCP